MSFNYGREKLKFDKKWEILAAEYAKAGFDNEGITAMREYDWKNDFKKRRIYQTREQQLPLEVISSNGDDNSVLFKKFTSLSYTFEDVGFTGRFDWIQSIENPHFAKILTILSDADKELLTLLAIDGYNHGEIAAIQKCSRQAITKKIKRIKNLLKNS